MFLTNIFKLLKPKTTEQKVKESIIFLKSIPIKQTGVFKIAENKELTDILPFMDLLNLFILFPIEEQSQLNQNLNDTIISFRPTIFETCSLLGSIKHCLNSYNENTVSLIRRLPKSNQNSYLFFSVKTNSDIQPFDQKALDQLICWMKDILLYYDTNKTLLLDNEESLSSAIYSKLDVFYDFFYCLLCHLANIKCDHLKQVAVFVQEDY